MSRLMAMALLLGVVVSLGMVPVALATSVTGQVVDLSGVNDFNATMDSQTRTGWGKLFGYVGIASTAGLLYAGQAMYSMYAGSGTMAWIFGSRMVNTGMDSANSADLGTVVYALSHNLQVWHGFHGVRLLQDPVFYVALIAAALLMRAATRHDAPVRLA